MAFAPGTPTPSTSRSRADPYQPIFPTMIATPLREWPPQRADRAVWRGSTRSSGVFPYADAHKVELYPTPTSASWANRSRHSSVFAYVHDGDVTTGPSPEPAIETGTSTQTASRDHHDHQLDDHHELQLLCCTSAGQLHMRHPGMPPIPSGSQSHYIESLTAMYSRVVSCRCPAGAGNDRNEER